MELLLKIPTETMSAYFCKRLLKYGMGLFSNRDIPMRNTLALRRLRA